MNFEDLVIAKKMTGDQIIGLMLRDDKFLNLMSKENTAIDQIWREMTGNLDKKSKSKSVLKTTKYSRSVTTQGFLQQSQSEEDYASSQQLLKRSQSLTGGLDTTF